MSLITYTRKGLYCPPANVYIDPSRKVNNAIITHGHSDHARKGHQYYVCSDQSVPILKHRLGQRINIRGLKYGEIFMVNGVAFSLHPAGHIIGSAQVRVAHKGEVWVISGDYKRDNDGLCTPFEAIKCHHFITECTFGMPIYQWPDQELVLKKIKSWWFQNASLGITSVLIAYSLGKAQRLIHSLGTETGPIYTHTSIDKMNKVIRQSGINLALTQPLSYDLKHEQLRNALIITPGSRKSNQWPKLLNKFSVGMASGWMALPKAVRNRGADIGFVLSDHCDWPGLNDCIRATGAENIYPTHGNTASFSKWLTECGYNAKPIEAEFEASKDHNHPL